ncbi:MAG: alpha/beta hydrolase [Bacteroidota bacterium]
MTPSSQLNLRQRHPDFQQFLDHNERESARVRESYPCFLDEKYGANPLQSIDVFPAATPNSPIVIFIHGGYWRALDKASYSFVAEPFVKHGLTVCVVNYRLIPSVDMQALLGDITAAIRWIQQQAARYHGDPHRMVLSGHSAGGHLALMSYLMHEDLRSDIQAICSLSGIFDLGPIKNSYLNEVLALGEEDVDLYSASNKDLSSLTCPLLLSVGANETAFFIEESQNLYEHNRQLAPIEYYLYPGLNHYQIVHQLGKEESPLVEFILRNIT